MYHPLTNEYHEALFKKKSGVSCNEHELQTLIQGVLIRQTCIRGPQLIDTINAKAEMGCKNTGINAFLSGHLPAPG